VSSSSSEMANKIWISYCLTELLSEMERNLASGFIFMNNINIIDLQGGPSFMDGVLKRVNYINI